MEMNIKIQKLQIKHTAYNYTDLKNWSALSKLSETYSSRWYWAVISRETPAFNTNPYSTP